MEHNIISRYRTLPKDSIKEQYIQLRKDFQNEEGLISYLEKYNYYIVVDYLDASQLKLDLSERKILIKLMTDSKNILFKSFIGKTNNNNEQENTFLLTAIRKLAFETLNPITKNEAELNGVLTNGVNKGLKYFINGTKIFDNLFDFRGKYKKNLTLKKN